MVMHDIVVSGVGLNGVAVSKPVLLQMNREDFPAALLRDLAALGQPPLSSAQPVVTAPSIPGTFYHPVTRVLHVALVQLACESVGSPRLDPARVLSAGLVIRRVPRLNGVSELSKPAAAAWQWMRNANGQFAWLPPDPKNPNMADADPDPTLRPQVRSGQPALDQLLAVQTLSSASTEVSTPAFVAAPDVCGAAQRTLAYALIPTASKEASTQQPPPLPSYHAKDVLPILPTLLKAGHHCSPYAGKPATYLFMSDDYAKAQTPGDFVTFSATLRLLYTALGAFGNTPDAQALMKILNRRSVTVGSAQRPVGDFFSEAASKLIDYDPNLEPASQNPPQIQMPDSWEFFTHQDQVDIVHAVAPLLQAGAAAAATPQGRFQDATRLYRVRMFFRIKPEPPCTTPQLVWSCYSDPIRIAAWYESGGRPTAPIPLPDPTDRNLLQNAKKNSAFAVPSGLMSAMQGSTMSGLSSGTPPGPGSGGGIGITWICSFSIPLITICAYFVLNLFLSLLNIVFFWMAFIKICIPIPVPKPSGGED